jgi:hypothetical protein
MNTFLFGNIEIKRINLRDLPTKVQVWSYLMVFVPILCIPGYALYKLVITPGRDFDEVNQINLMKMNVFDSFSLASSTSNETG